MAVARLPHGAIRALATVSGANDRPLSHLRCPSYTVVGQLSGVGHEVADKVPSDHVSGWKAVHWAEMAAPRGVGPRNLEATRTAGRVSGPDR
jgi:hypothetical protein